MVSTPSDSAERPTLMDFRDMLESLTRQIDADFESGEDVSQDLWDLHVEAKLLIKQNPR
jgi:hypothetical protein